MTGLERILIEVLPVLIIIITFGLRFEHRLTRIETKLQMMCEGWVKKDNN
jgi:hypothetical protein